MQVEQLAEEMAGQVQSDDDLSEMMLLMHKSVIEPMSDSETDVHLRRRLPGFDEKILSLYARG